MANGNLAAGPLTPQQPQPKSAHTTAGLLSPGRREVDNHVACGAGDVMAGGAQTLNERRGSDRVLCTTKSRQAVRRHPIEGLIGSKTASNCRTQAANWNAAHVHSPPVSVWNQVSHTQHLPLPTTCTQHTAGQGGRTPSKRLTKRTSRGQNESETTSQHDRHVILLTSWYQRKTFEQF